MKLRELHIEDYKMFKDFDIDFLDENDEALPIVVLAGVNGSGKTTLLEYLNDFFYNQNHILIGELIFEFKGKIINSKEFIDSKRGLESRKEAKYRNEIIYSRAGIDKVENIKETIRQKYIDRAFEIDKPSQALKELQVYIQEIFDGLDLTFNLSSIDYNKKEVLFKDNSGNEFDIDELSTGEKTLLSKVLYLYFQNYKNKVILIDEPELSLHPSWQNKILKIYENFAKQNNCQIIRATHSPHIIGSAKNKYLRFLVREDEKIVVKKLTGSPLDRDINTIIKTLMGANYIPKELEDLHIRYRNLVMHGEENTEEAKRMEKEILEYESPNSSFFQSIAFDKELMG